MRPAQPGGGQDDPLRADVVAPGVPVRPLVEPERHAVPDGVQARRPADRRTRYRRRHLAGERVHRDEAGFPGQVDPLLPRVGTLGHRPAGGPQPGSGRAAVRGHPARGGEQHHAVERGAERAGEGESLERPDHDLRAGREVDLAQRGDRRRPQEPAGRFRHVQRPAVGPPRLRDLAGGQPPADASGGVVVTRHRRGPDDDGVQRTAPDRPAERGRRIAPGLGARQAGDHHLGALQMPGPGVGDARGDLTGPGAHGHDGRARREAGQRLVPQRRARLVRVPGHGQADAHRGDAVADRHVGQAGRRHGAGQPGNHLPRPGQRPDPLDHARHGPGPAARPARRRGRPADRAERGIRQQGHAEQDHGQHPAAQPRGGTRRAHADAAGDRAHPRPHGLLAHPASHAAQRPAACSPGALAPRLLPHNTTVGETRTAGGRLPAWPQPPPGLPITLDASALTEALTGASPPR